MCRFDRAVEMKPKTFLPQSGKKSGQGSVMRPARYVVTSGGEAGDPRDDADGVDQRAADGAPLYAGPQRLARRYKLDA